MSLKWITVNARLKNGISLINLLTVKKFHLLLSHIVNSEHEQIFSSEELQKLGESLKLNPDNIQLLIQSVTYIFKQASKVIIKPTDLQDQLTKNLAIDSKISEEFVKIWSDETKKDVGDFENRMKLENICWEENIEIADQICNKLSKPTARVQLNMCEVSDSSKKQDVTIEFDKDDLLQLYNTLEVIQIKLDNLHNIKIK